MTMMSSQQRGISYCDIYMAVAEDLRTNGHINFVGFVLVAFFVLLLTGLAVVVVDPVLRFVGFGRFPDAAIGENLFLIGLLGEVVLGNCWAYLLDVLLAGSQRGLGEIVL